MAKYQDFLSRVGSNRDRAALRGIFSQFLTDDDPPQLKDLTFDSLVLASANPTQISITGASTTGLSITGVASGAAINVGASGSPAGDVNFFGATAAAKMMWDSSADSLLLQGNARLQVGESTTGVVIAGGTTMIYGWAYHKTNALTGTLRGIRGNAGVLVASAAGEVIGGDFRAANGSSTSATDGVNVGTLRGVGALVAGVGQSGPAVITRACGVYTQLDIDAANLTITDARGVYVNVQSGNASGNTLTACNLAYLEYESVVGTAPAINSAIKVATVGGATGATCLIDASTFKLGVTNTDNIMLFKILDANGAVKTISYDTGTPGFVFA